LPQELRVDRQILGTGERLTGVAKGCGCLDDLHRRLWRAFLEIFDRAALDVPPFCHNQKLAPEAARQERLHAKGPDAGTSGPFRRSAYAGLLADLELPDDDVAVVVVGLHLLDE